MGYRRLTQTEFKYIKELLKKHKGKRSKVANITNRSYSMVMYIDQAETFNQYCSIRPSSVYPAVKTAYPTQTKTDKDEPLPVERYKPQRLSNHRIGLSKESMAILAELQNLRKATFSIAGELKKMNHPMITANLSKPAIEQQTMDNFKKSVRRSNGFSGDGFKSAFFGLAAIILALWLLLIFI